MVTQDDYTVFQKWKKNNTSLPQISGYKGWKKNNSNVILEESEKIKIDLPYPRKKKATLD